MDFFTHDLKPYINFTHTVYNKLIFSQNDLSFNSIKLYKKLPKIRLSVGRC